MKRNRLLVVGMGCMVWLISGYLNAQSVAIDASTEYQTIRGFGGINMPGWIADLTADQTDKAFGNGPGQIGMSILRVRVPFDNTQFYREVPTAVRAVGHGAIVFASPWSPPAYMKTNNNTTGGRLDTAYYDEYAEHLDSFANYMGANGAPLYAISLQNEPDIQVSYESCDWWASEMIDFLIAQRSKISTRVIAPESFQFRRPFTDSILNNSSAEPLVDIVGAHIYGGGLSDYPLARDKGKEVWMTEHYTESSNPANAWPLALNVGTEIHNCMTANFNAYIWWYIRRSYGPITEDGNISKRGYCMSQYSKFARPGYVRVGATVTASPGVNVTAYKTDTTFVIVAVNTNTSIRNLNFSISNFSVDTLSKFTTSGSKNMVNDGAFLVNGGIFNTSLDAQSVSTFVSYTGYMGTKHNLIPEADAGTDQTVTDTDKDRVEPVTLDASGSSDPDGSIDNYTWKENGNIIASGISPDVEFNAGIHTVVLTVTDDGGALNTDTVIITVKADPVANAGPDISASDNDGNGSESVNLNGTGSFDNEGLIVSYSWNENNSEIANGVNASFGFSTGLHEVILFVTDEDGATGSDTLIVFVNSKPEADAGEDLIFFDEDFNGTEQVNLNATASNDEDDNILSYTWSISDTVVATEVNPSIDLPLGIHVILLEVTDDFGAVDSDTITVIVNFYESVPFTEKSSEIIIYPNPTKKLLYINISNSGVYADNIMVYNNIGVKVLDAKWNKEQAYIDISELKPGLYFIKIDFNKQSVIKGFIKE